MDLKSLLVAVMIATGWILFYGMIGGLVWFGKTASDESNKCVAFYLNYTKTVEDKCTIRFNSTTTTNQQLNINGTMRLIEYMEHNYTITDAGLVAPNGDIVGTLANVSSSPSR